MAGKKIDVEIREASGSVDYSDRLTSFLYQIMRDELPVGKVESLVRDVSDEATERQYTNGWLAKYANNLAKRLVEDSGANDIKSKTNDDEDIDIDKELFNYLDEINEEDISGEMSDDELLKIEQQIIQEAKGGGLNEVSNMSEEELNKAMKPPCCNEDDPEDEFLKVEAEE